jgi:hypothetical protein
MPAPVGATLGDSSVAADPLKFLWWRSQNDNNQPFDWTRRNPSSDSSRNPENIGLLINRPGANIYYTGLHSYAEVSYRAIGAGMAI